VMGWRDYIQNSEEILLEYRIQVSIFQTMRRQFCSFKNFFFTFPVI
jgi:hypothetical protein